MNIRFSLAKLCLAYRSLDAVGFIFGPTGYKPRDRTIDKLLQMPFPKDKSTLRSYLGLLNQFGIFSSQLREIKAAFSSSLAKDSHVIKNHATETAFLQCKEIIANLPMLHHVDPNRQLFVDTDASDTGTGAVIYHKTIDGKCEPIRFDSQIFSTNAMRHWHTAKKELYSIVRAFSAFEYLLYNNKFVLRTDHRNLLWMMKSAGTKKGGINPSWYPYISLFDFNIVHVPGHLNVIADSLSRLFWAGPLIHTKKGTTEVDDNVIAFFHRAHNSITGHPGINKTLEAVKSIMDLIR